MSEVPPEVAKARGRHPTLRLMSEIMVETPVWGSGGPLTPTDLVEVGVAPDLVRRLNDWNDWVWEDWNAQGPGSAAPGWEREGRRLARELQNQVGDVQIVMFDCGETGPLRDPDGIVPDGERPTAVTVMAAPTVEVPVWSFPFGRSVAVDVAGLFVLPELVERLRAWNGRFPAPARLDAAWCADGLGLARELQNDLWDVDVHYFEDDRPAPVRTRRAEASS